MLAFILTVFFHAVIRTNFSHYNTTLTPFLIPVFTFFIKDIYKYFSEKKVYFTIFLCILFSAPWMLGLGRIYSSFTDRSRKNVILAGETIDKQTSEGDKIIFLGFPCRIYLFTQRDTASRYIYQTSDVNYEPTAQNEFLMDLYRNKPAIIAVENKNGRYDYLPKWYAPVYDMIESEYQMVTNENGYFLFKRTHTGGSY